MPYLVKEGDPAPWFTGTINSLGGLADMALRDADAARRERLMIQSEQRQAADQTARMQADQQFRREMDQTNYGQQVQLSRLNDQQQNQRMNVADQRKAEEEAKKLQQDQTDARSLQGFAEAAGLLPREAAMPEGVAGPGSRLPLLNRPEDARTAISAYGQQQGRQATAADKEADNARQAEQFDQRQTVAQQRLELDRQRLDMARQRLSQASQRRDLTPEQQDEVRAALEAMNDPRATPEDYAAAFMIARKYDYAPVGAAVQKREDPQDSAEARVLRGKIERASKALLANYRTAGSAAKAERPKLEAELTAMETEYQKRFGGAAATPGAAPSQSPDIEAARKHLMGEIQKARARAESARKSVGSTTRQGGQSPARSADPFLDALGP